MQQNCDFCEIILTYGVVSKHQTICYFIAFFNHGYIYGLFTQTEKSIYNFVLSLTNTPPVGQWFLTK